MYVAPLIGSMKNNIRDVCSTADWCLGIPKILGDTRNFGFTPGLPEISGITRYPMIFKTESGRVSKEIPGIGSGSGTRWALKLSSFVFLVWNLSHFPGIWG